MKRRKFVKNVGKGISSTMVMPGVISGIRASPALSYTYPAAQSLQQIINDDGHLAMKILLTGRSSARTERLKGEIAVEKGKINRMRAYFILGDNQIDGDGYTFDLSAYAGEEHILAVWIEDPSEETRIQIRINGSMTDIRISDMAGQDEYAKKNSSFDMNINLLHYHEIAFLRGDQLPFASDMDEFRFVIMADPQGGDPSDLTNDSVTRVKVHNAFIEESIARANELTPRSLFTLILGDFTDSRGQESNFNSMIGLYKKLDNPILLEIGNHETDYNAIFAPGYNMNAFRNYFAAQKKVNGLELLLYSFNAGRWHFIVWPDPLRRNFWETHPHYFDWLEKDLAANRDRPVAFFQHVPVHPIGINPLVSYLNPVHINRLLFEILAKWDNVKYVFSGHVHIPVIASEKTAVNYKGINFINLPPTGYRPRAFGEQDLYGGLSQGICIVDINGDHFRTRFQTVTRETYDYSDRYRELDEKNDPLWFRYKWELDGQPRLTNGGFEEGMTGWHAPYIYRENENPSNVTEIVPAPGRQGDALYLYAKKRGYDIPGQDRLPQTINQVCQPVQAAQTGVPCVRFTYMVDEEHFHPETWNGAFLWVEGYDRLHLVLSHLYTIGKAHGSVGGSYLRGVRTSFFDLPSGPGSWHEANVNIYHDFKNTDNSGQPEKLNIDKYILNFGVWTINAGFGQETGIYFDDVEMIFPVSGGSFISTVDDHPVRVKPSEEIFRPRISHLAGEHHYGSQQELYPY